MKFVLRLARSPRVAISLILAVGIYVGVVTAVPQAAVSPEEHALWVASGGPLVGILTALGFDRAHTSPLFLLLALLLGCSTAVCAWDRTRLAMRLGQRRGQVSDGLVRRIEHVDAVALVDGDSSRAEEVVAAAASSLGMKLRSGRSLRYAERGAWGLFGSPVFHWSIVALVLVTGLGQSMRWEGLIGVPQGATVQESASAYARLDSGPLALSHTEWGLRVTGVDEDKRIGDVEYGVVPTIAIVSGNTVLAQAEVYPNNPLRAGPLLIHLSDYGLSVGVEVLDAQGVSQGESNHIVDFDESSPSGTTASAFDVVEDGSMLARVSVEVAARDARGTLPRLRPPSPRVLMVVDKVDGSSTAHTLSVGDSVPLANGWELRVTGVEYYARLSVVRDWSVVWIYFLLAVSTMALTLALLVPYRAVWFRLGPHGASTAIHVVVVRHRRDELFGDAVTQALVDAGAIRVDPCHGEELTTEGEVS